jgi:hypothetical protein
MTESFRRISAGLSEARDMIARGDLDSEIKARARRETTVTVSLPAADVPMLRAMLAQRGWTIEADEQDGAGWSARG